MQSKLRFVIAFLLVLLHTACEKEIDLIPTRQGSKLVVEATVQNGLEPHVVLTRSFAYFNSFNLDSLTGAFVHNALITVSDGQREVVLKEYSRDLFGTRIYYYSADTGSSALRMPGVLNTTYRLKIEAGGEVVTAVTTLPALRKQVDSIWWQWPPLIRDSSRVAVFTRVKDPKGFGDYIRYFTAVNRDPEYPGFNSVFDDQVVDGSTYEIQVFRGQNRNEEIDNETFGFFTRGDTVRVRLANIDKATFDFWRTWEQNQTNLSNPFGVPVKILSNLRGNAVGYFGGYANSFSTLIIPRQ